MHRRIFKIKNFFYTIIVTGDIAVCLSIKKNQKQKKICKSHDHNQWIAGGGGPAPSSCREKKKHICKFKFSSFSSTIHQTFTSPLLDGLLLLSNWRRRPIGRNTYRVKAKIVSIVKSIKLLSSPDSAWAVWGLITAQKICGCVLRLKKIFMKINLQSTHSVSVHWDWPCRS